VNGDLTFLAVGWQIDTETKHLLINSQVGGFYGAKQAKLAPTAKI
jgi:hypothetical protein